MPAAVSLAPLDSEVFVVANGFQLVEVFDRADFETIVGDGSIADVFGPDATAQELSRFVIVRRPATIDL